MTSKFTINKYILNLAWLVALSHYAVLIAVTMNAGIAYGALYIIGGGLWLGLITQAFNKLGDYLDA